MHRTSARRWGTTGSTGGGVSGGEVYASLFPFTLEQGCVSGHAQQMGVMVAGWHYELEDGDAYL